MEDGVKAQAHNITWESGGQPIIPNVTLRLPADPLFGLVGPNGSGKPSLLRLLAGLRHGSGGADLLDVWLMPAIPRREAARRLALVEQQVTAMTAREVVPLGRTPHRGAWGDWNAADHAAVSNALAQTGMTGRADQLWSTLSGGEIAVIKNGGLVTQRKPGEVMTSGLIRSVFEVTATVCEDPASGRLCLDVLPG